LWRGFYGEPVADVVDVRGHIAGVGHGPLIADLIIRVLPALPPDWDVMARTSKAFTRGRKMTTPLQ
jgi:hypothetical protein